MQRRLVALLCLVPVVALAACGDGDESAQDTVSKVPQATTEAGAGKTLKVTETEFVIDPANPRLDKPGMVLFRVRNAGRIPHALEVEGPTGEVETDTIEPGAAATLRADLSKAGTYEWYCPIGNHEARGMKGRITVAGGGSGASADHSDRRHDDSEDDSGKDDAGKGDSGKDDSGSGSDGSGDDSDGRGGAGGGSGGSGVY